MRFGPKAHQYAKTCIFSLCWPRPPSSSCLAAAGRPRLVSLPAALLLPWGAGRASFSRVSRLSVLRTVMESTACSRCTSPGLKLRAALVGALLELVRVVLQQPELGGRLPLHVLWGPVDRFVRPGVVGPGGLLEVLRATCVARSFFRVWMPRSITAVARSSGRTASSGSSRSREASSLPMPRSCAPRPPLPGGLLGGLAHGLGALLCSDSRLPGVLAEVDQVGLQPVVGPLRCGGLAEGLGRGACACRPTSGFRASKAMACVTSMSRCHARRYSLRGSRALKSSARASIFLLSGSSTSFLRSRPSPFMSGRLLLLGFHGVEELQELCQVGLGHLRLHPAVRQVGEACVADHIAHVAGDRQAAGVPLVRGQGQLCREALRLHQRLVVDHDELALVRPPVRSGCPAAAAPGRCWRPRCCWKSSRPSSSSKRDRPRSRRCWSR